MAERVQVLGLDKVFRNLKGLESELKRKVLISAATAGAGVFKRAVLLKAPSKTGALKRSVGVRRMKKSLKDIVGAMVIIRTAGARTKKHKEAGDDAWYWFLLEYGWYAGGRWRINKKSGQKTRGNIGLTRAGFRAKNKRTRKKISGRKFIKDPFNSNKDTIKKSYMKKIKLMVDKYRGR